MDKKIKNRIIAISGEPVSGKGRTVEELKKELIKEGLKEENIHIISTGTKFREYFNKIIEFMKNRDNDEKLKEMENDPFMKQFLSNRKFRTSLTNTIAKIESRKIDLDKKDSIEAANNSRLFSDVRNSVDSLIDTETRTIGKQINEKERKGEVWIFDSRMAFDNIPEAFSVRLTSNAKVAGERLFNDKTRGKEDSRYSSIEEAIEEREERRNGENIRYKKRYNVDLENKDNYNLIIDTSYADPEDVVKTLLTCEKYYEEGKKFARDWDSPVTMIPCQRINQTWGKLFDDDLSLEEMEEKIATEGYDPSSAIEVCKINGVNYILEGHHRNFACMALGNTLIPYIDEMETEKGKELLKRGTYPVTRRADLFDHEDLAENLLRKSKDDPSLRFSYSEIYPNILDEIEKSALKDER